MVIWAHDIWLYLLKFSQEVSSHLVAWSLECSLTSLWFGGQKRGWTAYLWMVFCFDTLVVVNKDFFFHMQYTSVLFQIPQGSSGCWFLEQHTMEEGCNCYKAHCLMLGWMLAVYVPSALFLPLGQLLPFFAVLGKVHQEWHLVLLWVLSFFYYQEFVAMLPFLVHLWYTSN